MLRNDGIANFGEKTKRSSKAGIMHAAGASMSVMADTYAEESYHKLSEADLNLIQSICRNGKSQTVSKAKNINTNSTSMSKTIGQCRLSESDLNLIQSVCSRNKLK